MQEKKDFRAWVRAHRKELVAAGITIVGLLLLIAGIKNKDELAKVICAIKNIVNSQEKVNTREPIIENSTSNIVLLEPYLARIKAPHHVEGHPMKLAPGKNISQDMLGFIKENNIELPPNCTFRRSYDTGIA